MQQGTEIRDKRGKVKPKKETFGNTDERVDRVGESVVQERYWHRNAGSGDGNENQMQKGKGMKAEEMMKSKWKRKSLTHGTHDPVS